MQFTLSTVLILALSGLSLGTPIPAEETTNGVISGPAIVNATTFLESEEVGASSQAIYNYSFQWFVP